MAYSEDTYLKYYYTRNKDFINSRIKQKWESDNEVFERFKEMTQQRMAKNGDRDFKKAVKEEMRTRTFIEQADWYREKFIKGFKKSYQYRQFKKSAEISKFGETGLNKTIYAGKKLYNGYEYETYMVTTANGDTYYIFEPADNYAGNGIGYEYMTEDMYNTKALKGGNEGIELLTHRRDSRWKR